MTPKMFSGINDTVQKRSINPLKWHSVLGRIVAILIVLGVVFYIGFQIFNIVGRVSSNWQEIQFAYQKPEIVRTVRVQYESQANALDNKFTSNKPDQQTAVLKQVEQLLNSGK